MAPARHRLRLKIRIDSDALKIWDAVINPLKLAIWFCNKGEINPKLRGTIHLTGENCPATSFPEKEIKGSILELEPNRVLKFTWPLAGAPSEVTWIIDDKGRYCDFLVTHDKMPDKALMMDAWIIALYNLRSLIKENRPTYRLDYSRLEKGTIRREIFIEELPPVVYRALTQQSSLRTWFAANAEVDLQPDGKYTTGWKNPDGSVLGPQKILEFVENKKLVYDWHEPGLVSESQVTWELLRIGEKTRVTIRHTGFAPDKPNKACTQGWHAFLLVLKDFCESRGRVGYTVIDGDWSS